MCDIGRNIQLNKPSHDIFIIGHRVSSYHKHPSCYVVIVDIETCDIVEARRRIEGGVVDEKVEF